MGVKDLVLRWAVQRPHVLPVEVPGQWRLRALLDHELAQRDWPVAWSPADADILVVCGQPGPQLAAAVEVVWNQMPGPRVRHVLTDGVGIALALDGAVAALRDTHRDESQEPTPPAGGDKAPQSDMASGMQSGMDSHGDMAPAGIPLADGAEDRDGLEMDVLHIRLGPILPHWPGGFVLCCELHGDVIADAETLQLDAGQYPVAGGRGMGAARQCDHILDVLDLAGWPGAAERARRARDALLFGIDAAAAAALLDELELAVQRSHALRWSLHGLGPLDPGDLRRRGLPATWAGDAHDRLLRRIEQARGNIAPEVSDAEMVGSLPSIVGGLDVGAARLVIAGLGIDVAAADGPR